MEKDDEKTRKAGFRTILKAISFIEDVEDVLQAKFSKLEDLIEGYNANGMSGSRVKEILNLRVMVIKYST